MRYPTLEYQTDQPSSLTPAPHDQRRNEEGGHKAALLTVPT
jgi:hypothetical protein